MRMQAWEIAENERTKYLRVIDCILLSLRQDILRAA